MNTQLRGARLALLLLCGVLLAACAGRTYVGGNAQYPAAQPRGDFEYRLSVVMVGAPGHAFVDTTDKKVTLRIENRQHELLFSGEYVIRNAGNLKWEALWERHDRLDVIFHEWPSDDEVRKPAGGAPASPRLVASFALVAGADRTRFALNVRTDHDASDPVAVPEWVQTRIDRRMARATDRKIFRLLVPIERSPLPATLAVMDQVAQKYQLSRETAAPLLRHYESEGFELSAYEWTISGVTALTIDEVGKHDLASTILAELRRSLLGSDAITVQRVVGIQFTGARDKFPAALSIVDKVARAHSLSRQPETTTCGAAWLACYVGHGQEISISKLDAPPHLHIHVQSTDASELGEKLEGNLRDALNMLNAGGH